jgi:hypothetical protein
VKNSPEAVNGAFEMASSAFPIIKSLKGLGQKLEACIASLIVSIGFCISLYVTFTFEAASNACSCVSKIKNETLQINILDSPFNADYSFDV